MRSVDKKMEDCPLKHHIRCELWEKFARKAVGRRHIRKYLTLYSPAMMDIKHFEERGLIKTEQDRYVGVVGVTDDEDAYHQATTEGTGRPEFLLCADIDDLFASPQSREKQARALYSLFPFDVINLDYCNSVYLKGRQDELSSHLLALEKLVDRQRRTGAEKFAFFLTTRAEPGQLAGPFLDVLEERVNLNLVNNNEFKSKFDKLYDGCTPGDLKRGRYDEFVPIGLVKFISNILSSNGYEILDCDSALLVRDFRSPERWLMHIAILVDLPTPTGLRGYGRQTHLERKVAKYLDKRSKNKLISLTEKGDYNQLKRIHGAHLQALARKGFELEVPDPE